MEFIYPPAIRGAHKADGVFDGVHVHIVRRKRACPVPVIVADQRKHNGVVGYGFQTVGVGAVVHHGAGEIVMHGACQHGIAGGRQVPVQINEFFGV